VKAEDFKLGVYFREKKIAGFSEIGCTSKTILKSL
jgi:hypothetical protein